MCNIVVLVLQLSNKLKMGPEMENPHGLNTCGAHSFIVVLGICSFDFNWNKILHGLEERDFVKDILLLNGFLIGVIGPFLGGSKFWDLLK